MSYKKFDNCGVYDKAPLKGDNKIMTPIMSGLVFESNKSFRVKNNDMRVPPSVQTHDIDYNQFKKAYPQENIY